MMIVYLTKIEHKIDSIREFHIVSLQAKSSHHNVLTKQKQTPIIMLHMLGKERRNAEVGQ